MYKSKRQKNKSFDWYGLSQRFSIRKYHFGAASVLLGTALILGSAQSTAKAEETTADNKTEAVTSTPKDGEGVTSPTNVILPATEATTGAPVLDKKELSEEEIAKLAAEASKKDDKTSETATTEKLEVADKEKVTQAADSTDKTSEKALDDKADKKDEKKAENPIAATKTILEQLTSEAEVLNTTAANYAEKKVEDKSSKEAIAAAVAAAKVEIAASKKVLNEKDVTAEQLNLQLQRISTAIEAVYTEMKRAGHIGKVEAVLPGETATAVNINTPINKVTVNNLGSLTDEEVRAIEKEIRTANPDLKPEDKIEVTAKGAVNRTVAKVILANGRVDQAGNTEHGFLIGDVAFGTAGEKNYDQLREGINWFDFARAKITYADGTKVGEIEYVDNAPTVTFTSSKGRQERGRFTMVRTVLESTTHPELVGKKTNSAEFLASGIGKYTLWKAKGMVNNEVRSKTSEGKNGNEIYEALQEGMRFEVPTKVKGYVLTATVSSLSRKKVQHEVAKLNNADGEPANINRSRIGDQYVREDVILTRQDTGYSHLRLAGFPTQYTDSTGRVREGLTAFASAYDGGNVGVNFQVSATYNGRPVAVNAIAADSEDLNDYEFTQFETDGTPWQEFMRVNKNKANSQGLKPNKVINGNFKDAANRVTGVVELLGYDFSEWNNQTENGYGSQLFGPFVSGVNSAYDLPIGLTQDVKNLGVYINSNGNQSASIGFVVYDGGDAPASYGSAQHIIGNFNKEKNGKQVTATQPYLGDTPADSDFRTVEKEKSAAWVLDDVVYSETYKEISLTSGTTQVTNQKGQTGTYYLDGRNPVIRLADGSQVAIKAGEILKTLNTTAGGDGLPVSGIYNIATGGVGIGNLPDEGENQLLDPTVATRYTLKTASATQYVFKGVRINRGLNNDVAYARGWVDFNSNGKFDQYEASEIITVNEDGKYDFVFNNIPQLLNTSVDNVGVRLRVALDKGDLNLPTGVAGSGEVEDFQTHVIHPPRGTRNVSSGLQGKPQKIEVTTTDFFKANGKTEVSDYGNWNQIEKTIAPKFVLTSSMVARETATGNQTHVTDPKGNTVYLGEEVTLYDARGNELGTGVKVTNPMNKQTEYYLSKYTEYDNAGNKVGVYELNKDNNGDYIKSQTGVSKTTIDFTPELGYVGTAKGVAIRAWDENRISTGWDANDQTIKESRESLTLADKDKILDSVNKNVNNTTSMDSTYIPTVIDIKPVGKDETTIDSQGKTQSATPKIPEYGTVESITETKIAEASIPKEHVLINKKEPVTFAHEKNIPGKIYTEDTKVTEETELTYEDGGTATFKPVDKIPASTIIAENSRVEITGSGNVEVSNVRIVKGTFSSNLVPAGSVLEGASPIAPKPITVIRNGVEVTVNTGERIQKGDQLVTPLPIEGGNQHTIWKVTFQKGDYIPQATGGYNPKLVSETSVDQIIGTKGDSLTLNGNTYVNNNDTIPKGTRTAGKSIDLLTMTLPKATHVDPQTGKVTTVDRRYTKVTDNEIVIENEGTYTLVPKTTTNEKGETVYEDATVVFTPHPSFVGVGTGVTLKQPDLDYPTVANPDSVTRRYGIDYGHAAYTPTVTPNLTATITRKIHYVYEGDTSTAAKDKTPILTIDGKPVTNEQTLTYNRDYVVMSEDGQTEKDITVATEMTLERPITVDRYVRKSTGEVVKEPTQVTVLKPGDVVKVGTELPAGTVIVGAWKSINPENDHFTNIISPTLKGYTAEVQLPENEYTKSEKDGVQSHVRSSNQTPVGVYTPTIKDGKVNSQDVGSYEPMVSAVRADDKDDFDVYVYYKADKQVARVVYIDMDAANNADQGVLETHTGSKLEAEKSTTDTITKDETLTGDSATRIKYSTAATIAKYEAMGYELKRDGFTNDDDGNRIVGGRKFDEESVEDSANAGEKPQNQTFYVFLGHKRDTGAKTETADVTRTINYKYKDGGAKAAESVTETLNFKRNISIDMALAAAAFPEDTATFNAENTKATPEEKKAAQDKYDEVVAKYNAAAEKAKEDPTTSEALRNADKNVTATEKTLADAKKANNSLVITSESTQAQKDAKAATEAALQAAQEAYNNALTARDTARTNYLAADSSALAKAVITTQQALEAENAKVAAAKAEYEAKVKDNNASDADKEAALTKFTDALAVAKTAAANATAAKTAFTEAKDEEETLNDAKVAEAVKNKAVQDRENTTKVAKDAARQAYYDAIIAKVKEEAKKETPDKNKLAAVSFGEWKALGSTATNLPANEQLSDAEKQSDNAFNHVTSPTIAGYLADKVAIDKTDAIDPLADDYSVDVFYEKGEQRATVKFVEVDANNPDTVITPGVAEDLVEIGKTGDNFATLNTAAVKAAIKKLQDKGYTLVSDGFENPGTGVSNTTFDNDPKNDQEFVVKVKATVVEIPSFDPTKPVSNENPKPTPGVTPIDPNNPTGPKWTEDLIKAVKVQEEVTRTIKYVYEDGTEVPAEKLTDVADKKVKTLKFTRPGKINVVTGEITYGDWSADQTFDAVTSPTIENYTAAVAGVTPTTANVPAKTVSATDKDFEEVVVYKTKVITVDPNSPNYTEPKKDQPIDPTDPNSPKWTDELLAKLKNKEEVTRTVSYVYSNDTNKLNQAEKDGNKAGANVVKDNTEVTPFVTKVNFTRVAKVNPVTNEITYEDWKPTTPAGATAPDDTLEGNTTVPVIPGYVATGDVVSSKTDVTSVKAEDKDITEKVVYEALGKYVPVVPEGFTPPTIENPQYPNNDTDPTKPGDPTTRTTIPYVPGTTPVGPDGQPLTPKNGDKTQGYLPPTPTTPTGDTTITYVKDGTQIAVTHFIEVNSATDKTEKGAVATSIVDTGDTGKAFTKGQSVTDTINALKAKGYTVVDNGYPTDGTFDADATTNQEYKVLVTVKPVTITPNTDVPNPEDPNTPADNPIQPGKPIDPNNPDGPKWTKDLIDKLKDAREETVTRTITYKYSDVTSELKAEDAAKAGQKAADTVTNTVTFKRPVTIDPVTKEFTYGDWEATNGTTLEGKAELPKVDGYIATGDVDSSKKDVENVTATDNDITENVVYKAVGKYVPVIPDGITPPANTNVDPKPYTNDPQDGSKVKDPDPTNPVVPGTTTPIVPQVPGTTPVGPDGKPLKPVDSSDLSKGYVPPTPTDPTKDTSIIYVKDGSQVAVVHFIDEKGNSVNESVVETGDTGGTISTTKVDAVKAALAKDYEIIAPTDATVYTADKEGFYKEADRTFDAVRDKATGAAGEKVPSQQYYVIVKAKELPVVPTKPVNKNNEPVDPTDPTNPNKPRDPQTTVTPKPTDPVPNDPKGRTYGELGLVEQVTRTIDYVYDNGTKVEEDKLGTAKDERTKTLTFTRNAKINAVTGEVTYLDANGNATTKELAPWTPATTDTFNTVNSPVIDTYVLLDSNQKTITGETVVATDNDIAHKVVYKKAGSIKPQIPAGVTPLTPATDTPYPNNPQDPSGVLKPDPTKPTDPTQPNGPITPVIPEVPGYTPYGPNGKPLEKDPNGGYKVPDLPTDPTQDTPIVYVKNGSQLAVTKFVDVNGNGLAASVVDSGDEGTNFTKDADVTATINAILARGYEKVANVNATEKEYPTEAADKVFDKDASTDQEFTVTFKAKELPVDPTKPVDPNNKPVDPTNPTPENPTTPRDPETPVTPKPEDKVPNDPKGRTYGELGLVEQVTRTINYVKNDGSKAADPVKETLTFTRKAKINAVTGEVTYLDANGNATTKEAAPWTATNGTEFKPVTSPTGTEKPELANYTPTKAVVEAKTGVNATDEDIVETVVYNPSTTNVDPNPVNPGENPDPNKVVENDPKKRTLKELGLIEEVTHTVHYKLEDGSDAGIADNVQKVTFTRTAKIDSVTGAILEYGKWTPETKEFTAVTTPAKDGYIASAKTSTANANVGATDKDTEETIIYRKLGSYVPVVPAGVTPPADFDKTPKPYPNATPEDPTKPGTPTTTTIPEIPGTTPVGPDGTPLTKNPNGGYDLPPVPTDPTQNTTITYVKDGSQVAVTHFIEVNSATDKTEKGAVAQSIVDTGDTGKAFTKGQSVTDTINALKAKGYTVVENGYPENGTFDADATTNQEYKVLVTVKPVTITPNTDVPNDDPNTPVDPNNPIQPNKPIDPNNPEGPKWTKELIDKLRDARSETVTRTITYKYSTETSELKAEDAAKAGQTAADTVTNTVTFKRPVTIDPVTKEFTYGDWVADNNDTTLEGKADLPVVAGYVATGDVEASKKDVTDVKATDKDITENVVYKTVGKYVPVIPDGITPPANTNVDPKPYNNDPQDGSKVKDPDPTNPVVPGTTTPIVPQIPGTTPVGPDGKPLKPVDSNDLSKGYVPPTPTDPTKDTSIIYVKDGSQVAVVHFVDEKGNSVNESVVETGDTGNTISTTKADAVKQALEAKGYEVVAPTDALYTADKEGFYKEADRKFDAVSDKATGAADEKVPSQQYYVIVKGKERPVDPTKPLDPNNNPVDPTNPTPENPTKPRDPETPVTPKPEDKVPNDPKGRTYGELGLVEEVTRTINYVKNDGTKAAEPVKETLTFTRKAKINAVTGEVTYLDNDGNATTKEAAPWTPVNGDKFTEKVSPAVPNYTPTVEKVAEKTGVTATDEDIVETVVYNPTKQTVDPNAPKDPSTPDVTPKPNDVVPNDPKGRTYKELGLIEEVTRTVHYVYEDGTKAAEDKVQTITFTRTAEIDTVTGAISNFGTWTLKDENNTFEPETTEAKAGYVASAAKSTEVTGVQATDKDTEETIIYRKLGSYVPVVPAGVTPPADFDKTPKPYPNATPEDPTRPGTPTTPTTTIPEIPGTTPVGPDGTPLTKNPNGGYDLPPVPTDPTQNTTITYVKDGSQVAVVHFVDEKGRAVNESVVETGDTGNTISKTNVDAVKAKLEAKGYVVVEPTDALYTTDKEGFYKEETRTFDAVSDKSTGTAGEKVPSQQYYVIVKAKEIPADPTKPGTTPGTDTPTGPTTPENGTPTPGTNTPAKPGDKIPGDPLNRTYGDLGLVEEVTRTINYVKNDGSKAADPVKETLTFTRKAKINAVTGEVTYLDNDGNATTKEAAPWTPVNNDTTFDKVTSPSVPDYTPTRPEVPAKENVTATDEDIVETVVYNPTKVTVTPNDPNVDPEKPLNPNDPNGLKYKDLKLTEEVKRTITYTYADDVADTSKRGTDAAPKHETTVSFTRTATVNQATGEVTYGDWTAVNNDTTLEGKTELPVIPGYVATGDVESVKKDVANVSATDKDIVEKVVYKDLGKYVPVVPEGTTPPSITDPKYPNNPTDPTKPGEPTTTIPPVDGLTPLDPSTGKPLEPKDPNDLSKGYKPPVPQDPSKDTNIVYVKDGSQVTVVHFVDEDGNAVHTSFVEAGDAGAKFTKAGEVTKVVEELKAAGYTVVPNKVGQAEYPGEAGVFDSVDDKGKDGVSQVYYVTVAKTVPVTPTTPENPNEDPKNPKPGDPIDPNKPDGPKWTEDALNKLNNIKSVTRTITYVKDGTDEEVSTTEAPKVTNKVSFTRTAIVNPKDGSVVGYDTNGDGKVDLPATDTTNGWTAAGTAKFAEVKSPVVKGYVVKPNQDTQGDLVEADGSKVKASATNLTVDSPNQDLKVRYVPVGTWTPKVPDGETPIDPIPYPNDPKDPGKVVDPNKPTDPNDPNKPSVPVVPHIPGTTPKDPNGNPLKPVDPEDPSKGYVPPTPTTPTENTVIEYVKDDQKAVTKFVDPSGNPIPGVNNIEEKGKSGEPLTKATEVTTEIAKLIAKGYELVSNNYGKDNNGNFDKDSGKDQEYTVVLTPHVEPIKPFDPTNPNDPNKPKPGTPIDPNNPDGPKWTEELIKSLETTKHVTRTISYVDKDGNKVEYTDKDGNKSTSDVTDKVTFTREAKINLVTGKIEYGKWTPVNNDTTFDKVTSPVVPGYVLKDPAQKEVAETTGVTENSKDENIKVVYVPVGKLVPKVPDGVTPPTPTPYDNDPQDPGKVVPPSPTKPTDPTDPNSPKVPVIPHIPGTTPKVPKDPTKPVDPNTNPLVPLKPVDPKDPSKGYEVPPVPTNPGTDTPIVYENDKQKAITNFVDNNGKVVSDPVVDYGESGSKFTKSGDVESKIKELVKKGYIVTSNDYPSADTDRVFDNDKDKDQIFNVKVTPLIVPTDPNSPDKPQIPTDPTKPVGPNNPLKPVTPSNPEPGKPVFPEDPNSPKWPESVKDLVTESSATRTITYVDRDGKQVAATHTETIKFKRTAKVNLVTGDITYGEWTVVGDDTILNGNKLPKVDGYIARGGDIKESQEDIKAEAGKNITQTVVYAKLGSWIPRLPEGQTNVPPTPYPNDPTDPTKPGTDKPKVPYVPGFIPVDPNGNPLKPVDPNDPTKGYEVPDVPADPTQDTPIKYIPVPTPNNGGGNNGGGGGNTPTPQPQPNPTPQPEPSPAPVPVTPETPEQPVAPVTPEQPAEPATPQYMDGQRELPNTGTEANSSLAALGLLGALSGFGLIARKKRKDEE